MQYMLLIYAQEGGFETMSEADQAAELGRWRDYTEALQQAGAMVAGDALQRTATARSVRARDGEVTVTDGPFAETREALGGYYLLDVASEADAIAWAGRCPGAGYGTIEVRPVMVW